MVNDVFSSAGLLNDKSIYLSVEEYDLVYW